MFKKITDPTFFKNVKFNKELLNLIINVCSK